MADLGTLQARLAEAEAALHALATGTKVVAVERNGKKLTYTAATMAQLRGYIADLNGQIAVLLGTTTGRRRAIGVRF